MNKEQLEKMSDFEINCEVAKIIYGGDSILSGGSHEHVVDSMLGACSLSNMVQVILPSSVGVLFVDYCNNWSDIGPLILDNKITISPIQPYLEEHDEYEWFAGSDTSIDIWHKNPLRAAAIVYILMQEK